jgi:hypothetical protein
MAVLCAAAGTIVDVSNRTTLQMNPGDTLYFLVSNLSLHTNLDAVEFQFISQTIDPAAQFEVELASRDGVSSIEFPTVQVLSGTFSSAGYNGPVWSINGALQLPGTLSSQIFQNTRAMLVLHNIGPSVTLGFAGSTLPHDLVLSLQAGSTNAGAVTSAALYEDPPPADAPETGSWLLAAGGGVLLAVFSGALKRISYRRIQ